MDDEIIVEEHFDEIKPVTNSWDDPNGCLIKVGKHYKVKITTNGEYTFCKFLVSQKDKEGKYEYAELPVRFKDGYGDMNMKDGDIIKVLGKYERFYFNDRNDPNHYNPLIFTNITAWEILKSQKDLEKEAYQEYNMTIEMDDLPF